MYDYYLNCYCYHHNCYCHHSRYAYTTCYWYDCHCYCHLFCPTSYCISPSLCILAHPFSILLASYSDMPCSLLLHDFQHNHHLVSGHAAFGNFSTPLLYYAIISLLVVTPNNKYPPALQLCCIVIV